MGPTTTATAVAQSATFRLLSPPAHAPSPRRARQAGNTPLHFAAEFEQTAAMKALLEARANRDAQNLAGCTALTVALRFRRPGVAALLLSNGASLSAGEPLPPDTLRVALADALAWWAALQPEAAAEARSRLSAALAAAAGPGAHARLRAQLERRWAARVAREELPAPRVPEPVRRAAVARLLRESADQARTDAARRALEMADAAIRAGAGGEGTGEKAAAKKAYAAIRCAAQAPPVPCPTFPIRDAL